MSWNTDKGHVTCDVDKCDAFVAYPLNRASDGVDACHAASQQAHAEGWYVDGEHEGHDRCPTHHTSEEFAARIRNACTLKETLAAMGAAAKAGYADDSAVREAIDAATTLNVVVARDMERDQ